MPTHFYEERKIQQKDSRFIGCTSFKFFFPDLCSTSKDPIFLQERLHRSILQDLQRYCDLHVGFVDCKPCILLCIAQSNVLIDKIEISSPYL